MSARKYLDDTGLASLWAKITDKVTAVQAMLNSAVSTLTDAIAAKVSKSGDTMTGSLTMKGVDVSLSTPSSSSDDSGDLVWVYGNNNEKVRLFTQNTPTTAAQGRLLYRAKKSDGTLLFNSTVPTSDDVDGKLSKAGDTATGKITFNAGIGIKAGSQIANPPYFITLNESYASGGSIGYADTSTVAEKIGAVKKSGDTMSGQLSFSNTSRNIQIPARSISYVDGAKGNAGIYMPHTYNKDEWGPILCVQNKAGGSWSVGSYNGEELEFVNFTKANIDSSTNTAKCNWKLNPTNGFMGPWNGIIDDHNTNNTSDTWVPVFNGAKMQHRVIPRTIDGTSAVSFTRSHASVSYKEGLVCNRFGNVVTFAGYFSCGATIGANTALYSGLPKPAGGKSIYFTWSGYDFYLHPTDGTIRTNGQIVSRTYVGTFTYVCA